MEKKYEGTFMGGILYRHLTLSNKKTCENH